jgi:hypothetical protein
MYPFTPPCPLGGVCPTAPNFACPLPNLGTSKLGNFAEEEPAAAADAAGATKLAELANAGEEGLRGESSIFISMSMSWWTKAAEGAAGEGVGSGKGNEREVLEKL